VTFSIVGETPTPVTAHAGRFGIPDVDESERGFTLRVGPTLVYLTNEQAAALGRYLLFENNEPQTITLQESQP
jgi:hypothetical protein